jgi:DNA-binding MarR family transcriptional regulator
MDLSIMPSPEMTTTLRLMQAARLFEARIAGELSSIHGLSVNEALLLMYLEQAPLNRLPRVELAKRLSMSASTVTRMCAPMEKLGLVSKQADERDARLAFVVLTDAGRTRIEETRATITKHSGMIFADRWSAAEVDTLAALLGRLTAGSVGDLTQ